MSSLSKRFCVNRKTVWACTVFLLLCFYMFWPVNFYLAESLKKSYYMVVVPLLVGGVLYFRRLRDGVEFKLLVGYVLWFWLSRVLNGSPALDKDFQLTFDLTLMLPFFALGPALSPKERRRFLDWLSAVVGGFYFLLGLICLTAFLQQRLYINPITEQNIGIGTDGVFNRINVFDIHANVTGCWFLTALFLMTYEFFACRKKLWRIPIVLAALVDYLVIAITYSRGVQVSAALAFGLLAVMLLKEPKRPRGVFRILLLLASFAVCFLGTYKLFGVSADGLNYLSNRIAYQESVEEAPSILAVRETAEAGVLSAKKPADAGLLPLSQTEDAQPKWETTDPRAWNGSVNAFSSGRIYIWKSALKAIADEPDVLLRGRLSERVTAGTQPYLPFDLAHLHNSALQVLMTTGLPGFLMAAGMLLLMLVRCVKLLFSPSQKWTLADRSLAVPVMAMLLHFMVEAGLFTTCDFRTLFYFLLCGMALGTYRQAEASESTNCKEKT